MDYHDSEIKRYKAIGKYKYSEKQKYARKKLHDYVTTEMGKQDLTFNEFTPKFLKHYETYLIDNLGTIQIRYILILNVLEQF